MVRVYAWNLILHGPSGEGVSQSRVRVSQTLSEAIGQICHVQLSNKGIGDACSTVDIFNGCSSGLVVV